MHTLAFSCFATASAIATGAPMTDEAVSDMTSHKEDAAVKLPKVKANS